MKIIVEFLAYYKYMCLPYGSVAVDQKLNLKFSNKNKQLFADIMTTKWIRFSSNIVLDALVLTKCFCVALFPVLSTPRCLGGTWLAQCWFCCSCLDNLTGFSDSSLLTSIHDTLQLQYVRHKDPAVDSEWSLKYIDVSFNAGLCVIQDMTINYM